MDLMLSEKQILDTLKLFGYVCDEINGDQLKSEGKVIGQFTIKNGEIFFKPIQGIEFINMEITI